MRSFNPVTTFITAVLMGMAVAGHAEQDKAPAHQKSQAQAYGGGGIRGVTTVLPDGWLLSQDEAKTFGQGDTADLTMRGQPQAPAPSLTARDPQPGRKRVNPITVQMVFGALEGAPLDFGSIQVLYGPTQVDITARARPLIRPSADGFDVVRFRLPPGRHRLQLRAQDSQGRMAQHTVVLEVE